MVTAGHVADLREAFDDWLGEGRPAFMPREGPTPEDVLAVVHDAGGVVSLAHPGRTRIDGRIPSLVEAGLDALEVYHPDHKRDTEARYRALTLGLGCLMTGGSDFHGDTTHGLTPGSTSLPQEEWSASRPPCAGMREALLWMQGVSKDYRSLRPLRVARLEVAAGESVALLGFNQTMAEVFIDLLTGRCVPDEGEVVALGRPTTAIADADAWLATLDRFGIVSERAVLVGELSVEQTLALSFSFALDALSSELRERVAAIGSEVGLGTNLQAPVRSLAPLARLRVRLGRALTVRSKHPSAGSSERRAFRSRRLDVCRRRQACRCQPAARDGRVDGRPRLCRGGGRRRLDASACYRGAQAAVGLETLVRLMRQPSIRRTLPARGPLVESSEENSTRWPSRSSSNTVSRTELRWKKCSIPPSSRMKPKPLSMRRRAMVPVGMALTSDGQDA